MIYEVDEAVRALVRREGLNGSGVEVVLDAPTRDWAARRNAPTVNAYLYDIREDVGRRERGRVNEYDERNQVVARHTPPRWFRLAYMVTAWTQRPEDEHRLLSALLACFLRHESLPADLLTGPLAELALPVGLTVALPLGQDRSITDVWSALGGELKPSLDVVVNVPVLTAQAWVAGPPVQQPLALTATDVRSGASEQYVAHRPEAAADAPVMVRPPRTRRPPAAGRP